LPEGKVSESVPHASAARHLELVLLDWASRTKRKVFVARNFAIRWIEEAPKVGIDPDVCVLEPPPPNAEDLGSLRTWKPGHIAPPLCFEVVSANHPHKDYSGIQDRYAALGVRELVVFDPLLAGPASLGGPVALQVWRRDEMGIFERVHASAEPAHSVVLDAWLAPRGRLLEIAEDREGEHLWPTAETRAEEASARADSERAEKERERAEKEKERAEKEKERAEKEKERAARVALEARMAELEAKTKRGEV
jgi:hypothetical protein